MLLLVMMRDGSDSQKGRAAAALCELVKNEANEKAIMDVGGISKL